MYSSKSSCVSHMIHCLCHNALKETACDATATRRCGSRESAMPHNFVAASWHASDIAKVCAGMPYDLRLHASINCAAFRHELNEFAHAYVLLDQCLPEDLICPWQSHARMQHVLICPVNYEHNNGMGLRSEACFICSCHSLAM